MAILTRRIRSGGDYSCICMMMRRSMSKQPLSMPIISSALPIFPRLPTTPTGAVSRTSGDRKRARFVCISARWIRQNRGRLVANSSRRERLNYGRWCRMPTVRIQRRSGSLAAPGSTISKRIGGCFPHHSGNPPRQMSRISNFALCGDSSCAVTSRWNRTGRRCFSRASAHSQTLGSTLAVFPFRFCSPALPCATFSTFIGCR